MGIRRKSRELALQALFYLDMHAQSASGPTDLNLYCRNFPPDETVRPFFEKLVHGVLDHQPTLDRTVERHSKNWKIRRMTGVDRSVLRIAVFEMLFCEDIPMKVSINEAVDIAKKYGTEESGAFINGILDSIRDQLEPTPSQPTGNPDQTRSFLCK